MKRKFVEDDDDESFQDANYHPGGRGSGDAQIPSTRVTRSSLRPITSEQETRSTLFIPETSNEDENNTSEASRQTTADVPQASSNPHGPMRVRGGRVRRAGPTIHCGVVSPWKQDPIKAKRTAGNFFCPICRSSFTRSEGVNFHFARCAEKHGNPHGYHWYSDPSCASKKSRKVGPAAGPAAGPSTQVQRPAAKKRCIRNASSGPSTATSRGNNKTAQAKPVPQPDTLLTAPRATRSKASQKTSESRPDPGIGSSKQIQRVSQPSQARSKPRKKQSRNVNPESKSRSKAAPGTYRVHIDGSLPPLSDLDAIFNDMVSNAWEKTPLAEAMELLSDKSINIATMCSGTESPLLALGKIQNGLKLSGKPALDIKHLFSAEIVPYKQAYIERNFGPEKLFRDIREIAAGGQATTAYGALTDVPSDVDILVAGFSCVDFSKLNKNGKKLTDNGESGDTFRAILKYAKHYRPAVIILENVDGAPWNLIKGIWENDREIIQEYLKVARDGGDDTEQEYEFLWDEGDLAYSAIFHRVDAKYYYIPQTRTRRYMICLNRSMFPSLELADQAARDWELYLMALQRKPSVSVEAFLLPEDDPRLQRAKDELSKTGKPRRETNWEVCNGRYEDYRWKEKLGVSRPITEWTNAGSVKASSYLWTDWTLLQVERIWDTIDASFLRNAKRGFDSFHKLRFWELSQNIDRYQDNTPAGIVNCLTPTGLPFSTLRGGPIIGLEAIALQGLPIDVLLLTRESERELFDLAGNAMTSTVVGAALLSALIVSRDILSRPKETTGPPLQVLDYHFENMRTSELDDKKVLKFDGSGHSSLQELCGMAKASVSLCRCESQSLTASSPIRVCKRCNHYCCEKCGNKPKHDYKLLREIGAPPRAEPQEFKKLVTDAIPTRLEIDGISSESLEGFAKLFTDASTQDWGLFREAVLNAFAQEYHYESVKRSYRWTVTYNAMGSRMELIFDDEGVYWLLYGKPGQSEPGDSRVRKLLQLPLARLTVRGKTMRGDLVMAENLLEGSWEICLPINYTFSITITPQGQLTDSWQKKLGLQDEEYRDRQVYTSLHVARTTDLAKEPVLDYEICGDYELLEDCGTACSSLHKKKATANTPDTPSLFLFLDPDRTGPPDKDCYVFAPEIQPLNYGDSRYVTAKVDSKWRPFYQTSPQQSDTAVSSEAECTVSSRWESCPMSLRVHEDSEEAYCRFPEGGELFMPVFGTDAHPSQHSADDDQYGCLQASATTAFLSCEIPGQMADDISWQVGRWTIIDQRSERQIAAALAWLLSRVMTLGNFDDNWRKFNPPPLLPDNYRQCLTCVPESPKIMWTCSRSSKQNKIIPYEDGREAGEFERRIKARPTPFMVLTHVDDDEKHTGRLLVGLHLPTLVHRALAALGNVANSDVIDMDWRLDAAYEAPTHYKLEKLTLPSNQSTESAEYDFPTSEQLRPEQKRSLQRMILQEADDMAFYEEEIEEATLPQLNWRAEVRVRRTRFIRGGVLADEVGYGKTATTLALIDKQKESAKEYGTNQSPGCMPVQATLILVPPHLVHQWKGQARKFLGITVDTDKILVMENMNDLGKISVQKFQRALIIIVSWKILMSPTYMARMSHFAALPPGPSTGEREIDAWLARACGNIEQHMGELVSSNKKPKLFAKDLKARLKAAYSDKDILRDVPTQRLKGARYTTWNPAECVVPQDLCPPKKELDQFFTNMTKASCKDLASMTGNLLHMFDFYRIVVDEYTYVDEDKNVGKVSPSINKIKARSRWVLSGTPNIQDFGEVRDLASFLGYNLGVVDDAAGVIRGATIRRIREHRTAAEQFRAFGYSHTAAWHINRQAHAQKFLDQYASKNVAEIGHIPSTVHLRPHFLGVAEKILNAELQQQLQSTEMKIVLHGKGKKDNDRLRRYMEVLKGCKTAPECLLKSLAFFEMENTQSAEDESPEDANIEACESLIAIRKGQMEELVAELESHLLHAAWLGQQCQRATEPQHRGSHYLQWKSDVERTGLRDPTATSDLREYLKAAAQKVGPDTEEIYYRDPPTAKELKKEKEAADKRIKQAKKEKAEEKAKKAAAKKAKAASTGKQTRKSSRSSKAVVSLDEGYDERDVDDLELQEVNSADGDDVDPNPPVFKPNKIPKDNFKEYENVLRSLTGHLRSLTTELISRARSLRFARGANELYRWYTGVGEAPECGKCCKPACDQDDININLRCGHTTCKECIKEAYPSCAINRCGEGAEVYQLRKCADLVGEGETWSHGAKVGHIIELIGGLPQGEQVLLFVQFEDAMVKIASALEEAKISNYALSNEVADAKTLVEMMRDFQDNEGEDKKKVLLLNPSSEVASGINLTNANHIIFVSPLLTKTQYSYHASMTQCIGRAKRYGQQKTVHVYRFVALKTIDVDILQEREAKTLVKMVGPKGKAPADRYALARNLKSEWCLVDEQDIDDTVEAGWGSGYNFKSNPDEED